MKLDYLFRKFQFTSGFKCHESEWVLLCVYSRCHPVAGHWDVHPWKWSESRSVMSDSLQPHRLYRPWNSPGQNTGVGSLSLLQGIFPTQRLNPGLPHYRRILYQLSHKGSPRILEWVACLFSRGSSWPRNQTGVSCILYQLRYILYQLSYQGRRPWKSEENFAFLVPLQVSSESPFSPTFFLLAKRPKGESRRMGRTISAFEFLKVSGL